MKITTTKTFDPQEVADVIVRAIESGYSWWHDFRVSGTGGDWWDRLLHQTTTVRVWAENPEGDGGPRVVKAFTPAQFAQAWVESGITLDAGDVDAPAADYILQKLVYGEEMFG